MVNPMIRSDQPSNRANPTAPVQSSFEMPDFSMLFSRLFPVANPDRRSEDYTIEPRPEVTGACLLFAATLIVGIYPSILLNSIEPAVKALLAGGMQ